MAVFVFIVNVLIAAFICAVAVEMVALLIGSIGVVIDVLKRRRGNG